MLATVCLQPKIFLAVFIGSRIAKFSDKDLRGQMNIGGQKFFVDIFCCPSQRTTGTQILNGASIVVGLILGVGLGW